MATPQNSGIAGNGVAGLQDEARRGRADVAQLDDLDGARGVHTETGHGAAAGQLVLADLQGDLAADIDDGFVKEAEPFEFDAAGDLDVEDLAESVTALGAVGLVLQGLDELEAFGFCRAGVARLVLPAAGNKRQGHGTSGKTPVEVVAEDIAVTQSGGLIIGLGGQAGGSQAGAGQGELVAVNSVGVQLDVAGGVKRISM